MSEQWFSKESFVFLEELKANNSKKWYTEKKENYERLVLEQIKDFVYCISPTMLRIDDEMEVRPQIGKTISRINLHHTLFVMGWAFMQHRPSRCHLCAI